ncbi:hypothetical protein GCM10027076_14000 [Nocardioides montaniterrae]
MNHAWETNSRKWNFVVKSVRKVLPVKPKKSPKVLNVLKIIVPWNASFAIARAPGDIPAGADRSATGGVLAVTSRLPRR